MIRDSNGYSRVIFFYIYTLLIIHQVKNLDIYIISVEFWVFNYMGIYYMTIIYYSTKKIVIYIRAYENLNFLSDWSMGVSIY